MKINYLYGFVFAVFIGLLFLSGCKKLDIDRLALVKTMEVSNITTNAANITGEIVDAGEQMISYGFVIATFQNPTITDQKVEIGTTAKTGNFSGTISGLSQNTNYWVRGYVEGENETVYGDNVSFKTVAGTNSVWLNYDNGQNTDGIGLLAGGSFDVAIRFSPAQLAPYSGYRITKVRFFPRMNWTAQFSIEVFSGASLTSLTLDHLQSVPSPDLDQWNEVTLSQPYTIDASRELLVGYWIFNQTAGDFPAGIDSGPANVGYGDLISLDDGTTWSSLTQSSSFDANWNIQVYVINESGKEFKITPKSEVPAKKLGYSSTSAAFSSFNSSNR